MAISIILFILLIAFCIWVLQASSWSISVPMITILAMTLVVTLGLLVSRPFVFSGKDANNIILYGIYLINAGAVFSIPVDAFKEQIFAGKMPAVVKRILVYYLTYSILLLILITVEAIKLRS